MGPLSVSISDVIEQEAGGCRDHHELLRRPERAGRLSEAITRVPIDSHYVACAPANACGSPLGRAMSFKYAV